MATNNADNNYVLAALKAVYPVGSTYFNVSDSTNPGTLFGFGTWVALGGVTLAGISSTSGSTFNVAAGTTVGEEKHTLTNGEMPVHSITISHHGDEGGSLIRQFSGTGGTTSYISYPGSYKAPPGSTSGANSYQSPTVTWGSNTPHNVVQPTVVGYLWQRTA